MKEMKEMRSLVVLVSAWLLYPCWGQEAGPVVPDARSNNLYRTGGGILIPAKGPVIKIVNCQADVKFPVVAETAAEIARITRLPVVAQDMGGKKDARTVIGRLLSDTNVAAVVIISGVKDEPPMLIAPEARWAIVNALALKDKDSAKQVSRVRKEIWRAFAYVMGAANSSIEQCVLKPVFSPEDLDTLKPQTICPEPMNKIMAQAARLGISPARMTSYRKACEEGWAPAPTNDFQKAVWDEVKGKNNNN